MINTSYDSKRQAIWISKGVVIKFHSYRGGSKLAVFIF